MKKTPSKRFNANPVTFYSQQKPFYFEKDVPVIPTSTHSRSTTNLRGYRLIPINNNAEEKEKEREEKERGEKKDNEREEKRERGEKREKVKEEKEREEKEREEKEREEKEEETYIFTTNVNQSLSKILGIPEFKNNEQFIWEPPKEYGLSNSNYIIEPYYALHKDSKKIYDIDYFVIIKDDIKNFRKLNTYQINFIKDLPEECKNELLEIYNNCMEMAIDLMAT